jgi:hypothetical protein
MLLAECWRNQRRQMIATLPYLVQLVKNSANRREWDREIHRTARDSERFRAIMSETLSTMGLLDQRANAVRDALAHLAIDPHIAVQLVAASVMAVWIYADPKQVQLLHEWQFNSRLQSLLEAIFANQEERESQTPQAYMRSTIALTVGYAARFYNDNRFPASLLKQFDQLANDPNKLVLNRFTRYTLPQVVTYHLRQVQGKLEQLIKDEGGGDDGLYRWIAAALASAYQYNPTLVSQLIRTWYTTYKHKNDYPVNTHTVSERERFLSTIAWFYGFVPFEEKYFSTLRMLIEQEKHPFVRTNVVFAITHQARTDLMKVAPSLQRFMADVIESERNHVIDTLKNIYLAQRAQQENGDTTLVINHRTYPVWYTPSERPLTPVETVMIQWVTDPNHPIAQQVALLTLIEFAEALDQPVDEYFAQLA